MPTRPTSKAAPRGRCPGCERHDVVLLEPTATKPWRRKAHAVAGDLGAIEAAERCRYPTTLTDNEIPQESECA